MNETPNAVRQSGEVSMQPSLRLDVNGLNAWYGESHVLQGVSLQVRKGEVITLLGRNGAGKTTTLRALMGLVRKRSGSVVFEGTQTIGMLARRIARLGIGYVPEERGIFSSLTVEENLMLPPILRAGGLSPEHVLRMFPNLAERRRSQGTKLSGGEQQMLALGRILRTGADFLLLDEPTEGLAPVIVRQIEDTIVSLKRDGYTILIVEQNLALATRIADRHYVMEGGLIVDEVAAADVVARSGQIKAYLGI
jgi:branched-chain amino acid transport system ATP-binding protein